jgi:DNA polymerase I-like protein with 3'-5' exonuclease and polymerase domains
MVRKLELEKELQEVFPPTIVEMKSPAGWKVEVEGYEYTAKTKTQLREELKRAGLKQSIANLAEKTGNKKKEIPFNAGSRDQIAERLMANGWKPESYEGKRPEINETVLKKINTKESLKLLEYLLVQKRLGQLVDGKFAWLTCVTPEGRIHGSVNTAGTVTGRCTHSQPNVSAVPSVRAAYGEETRGLFKAPEGKVLVGADASGIELRMLGHVLYKYDSGKYVREILEGDIHQVNADALGISRSEAKTWIYAYLYGCGNQLLGEIVGKGMKEGKRLRQTFLKKMPSFKKLTTDIDRAVDMKGHLTSIDGRILNIRSKHKALNSLLQSSASIVMKQALIEFVQNHAKHPYELHANIHDEVQFSCLEEHAKDLGRAFVTALGTAGKTLGIKCPLDGEFKIVKIWAETH